MICEKCGMIRSVICDDGTCPPSAEPKPERAREKQTPLELFGRYWIRLPASIFKKETPDTIPVIDYLAYEQVRRERDEFRAALERIANPHEFNRADKVALILSVDAFTEIARKALES